MYAVEDAPGGAEDVHEERVGGVFKDEVVGGGAVSSK